MLVKGNWTHTEPLQWGSDSSAWGEENPKGVGWGARGQSEEEKKGRRPSRKIIIDFILIDTDYPPIGYAIQRRRRWEMKREWKKSVKNRKEYIWKYIVKTYDKIRKIYVKWESPSWDTLYYFYPNYCSILTWNSQIPPNTKCVFLLQRFH